MKPKRLLDEVNLPAQAEVESRLFKCLKLQSRPQEPKFFYDQLAIDFGLSLEQRNAGPRSDPSWHWLVRQAKRRLVDEGIVQPPPAGSRKGPWSLTPRGANLDQWPPGVLTLSDLGL